MNGNNLNTNFEDLFRDFSEEPSSNCWDAISHKLDVVMPNAGSSAATQSAGGFSKFIASTIVKTVAVFSGVSVAGVALYAVLNTSSPEKLEIKNTPVSPQAQTEAVSVEKPEMNPTSEKIVDNSQNSPTTQSEPLPQNTNIAITPFVAENHSHAQVYPVPTHATEVAVKAAESPVILKEETSAEVQTEEVVDNATVIPTSSPVAPVVKKTSSLDLVFPNVFTPNGDGYNDMFVIKNLETVSNNRLVVIDANGLKVFEANNYQNNWDASNAPDGAYYYVFETKVEGVAQTFYGALQIIR